LTSKNCTKNAPFLADLFKSQNNIDAFLASSSLFEHAGNLTQQPAATPELRQLAAKLHCLYGVPIDCQIPPMLVQDDSDDNSPSPSYSVLWHPDSTTESVQIPTNNYARAVVYDLRRYTEESLWGPFKSDGSQDVDWEKVEAIMLVLGYNMRLFNRRAPHVFEPVWDKPFNGASPNSYISAKPTGIMRELSPPADLDLQDPYGITGEWMRVVCFTVCPLISHETPSILGKRSESSASNFGFLQSNHQDQRMVKITLSFLLQGQAGVCMQVGMQMLTVRSEVCLRSLHSVKS
jgi:hypothetical protein